MYKRQALDQAGNSLVDALRTDTRNVYAGALTLTQPLYMGGKIRAYNKITKYADVYKRQAVASESAIFIASWANKIIAFMSVNSFYIPEWYVRVPDTVHR